MKSVALSRAFRRSFGVPPATTMRRSATLGLAAFLSIGCRTDMNPGNGTPRGSGDGSVESDGNGASGAGGVGGRGSGGATPASGGATPGSGGNRGSGGAGGGATGGVGGVRGSGGSSSGGAAMGSGGSTDGGSSRKRTYETRFPSTENPISEGSNWINGQTMGLDWHDVSTTPGLAIGHQSGSSYTDGTALLTGAWGPTQSVEAVVHTVKPNDSCYQEVELRLRSALSAHSCTGYEISFKASKTSGAYLIIVRWNGPVGDFSYLSRYDGAQYGVADGDTVKATIAGNVITAFLNGKQVGTATDDTFKGGHPGMGFNLETADSACVGTNGDYGFTSLIATGE